MNYEMHGLEDPKVNIQMNYEMRVEEHSNPLVVFMHQMIPHHENAVNMARWGGRLSDYWEINCLFSRIALKHAKSAKGFNDEELDVPALLRDIINTQNKQIQDMQGWLERWLFIKHLKQWRQWFILVQVRPGKSPILPNPCPSWCWTTRIFSAHHNHFLCLSAPWMNQLFVSLVNFYVLR